MDAIAFVQELEAFKAERLAPIVGAGRTSLADGAPGDAKKMLQVALANEISVSELAAAWMPSTFSSSPNGSRPSGSTSPHSGRRVKPALSVPEGALHHGGANRRGAVHA